MSGSPSGSRISEVAELTGFTPSALRFYERHGLVQPKRSEAGYRDYSESDVTRLRFVRRAKAFGLTLEDITELLELWDEDRCAPVRDRLRELVSTRAAAAEARAADLLDFAAEVRSRSAALTAARAAGGACDEACGCLGDPPVAIACSLPAESVDGRIGAWRAVLGQSTALEPTGNGVRARFDPSIDVGELARLAAAEQGCCRFLRFDLVISDGEVVLEIAAPPEGSAIVELLVGGQAGSSDQPPMEASTHTLP